MKLVTFVPPNANDYTLAGWLDDDFVIDASAAQLWLQMAGEPLGSTMERLVTQLDVVATVRLGLGAHRPSTVAYRLTDVTLLAPLPFPRTIRDFYAFEAHVKTARANRGLPMMPEWYQIPVFYFTNPNAVYGPDVDVPKPTATVMLDFELEIAVVLGKGGRDIPAADAAGYIAGYLIMNDWSARDIQREEMKVGLGPAKGKDFATSLGPWLVTPDELADRQQGARHDLTMLARINGQEVARGNFADMHFSFAQLIERASKDCTLYPGEVIGSGTVGTGCLLETGAHPWLQPGDVVELEVERLGILTNTVR
jgi:fumarylacetoacetate (FAA) hydrolase